MIRSIFLPALCGLLYCALASTAAMAQADTKAATRHADLGEPVIWSEAGRLRRAWPAPYELAVRRRPGAAVTRALADASAREIGRVGRTAFVRLDEALDRWNFWSRTLPLAADAGVEAVSPAYYSGPDKNAQGRMALTGRIVVGYARPDPKLAGDLEDRHGLTRLASFPGNAVVYESGDTRLSLDIAASLAAEPGVAFAYPDWLRDMRPRAVPDDPLFPSQWHLRSTDQVPGLEPVWDSYRGTAAQVVAVVDDGLDSAHPDFQGNLLPALGRDFVDDDLDPSHGLPADGHGTSCAGVAAARGFNATGVCGVAPWTGLAGIRLLGNATASNASSALSWRNQDIAVYSNSWGPPDNGMVLEGPDPLTAQALAAGVATGRGGLGSIYVWAGGNGRQQNDNANYDGFANSRYTIAVAATDSNGDQTTYSEPGACLLVNAPSSGALLGITTTDREGAPGYDPSAYTAGFGGTSATAPFVAGVVALMLQANPELTWRDVQRILALSASKNDPDDASWLTNGAGLRVSHAYGFGRVNAQAAVALARDWETLPLAQTVQGARQVGAAIPDADPAGIISQIAFEQELEVEFVEVAFSASDHTYWSDLQVELTSPSGLTSVLAEARPGGGAGPRYDGWLFGSTLHLGESSRGVWTLRVSDRVARDTGTFQAWTLTLHGVPGQGGRPNSTIPASVLLLLPPG
ncbi:S8 family peptidase [Desulfocurvibacter africanus]|uniref:S8 family peptidase n=1 Tax=Desulfocurvibacter africanus TaxID=873 RepID=UPI00040B6FC1|nr:S8 family peptidase [Desulfocurvibacter africanus]